ncbi:cupin domain-containing protein [Paracidovorax citrulli]
MKSVQTKGRKSPTPTPKPAPKTAPRKRIVKKAAAPRQSASAPAPAAAADTPLSWIGEEIKSLRKAKGMSLQELSRGCGKSIGFLSQVERGLSVPSISDLHGIARVLGVQIGWFFPQGEFVDPMERTVIVRKAQRRQLTFASGIADFLLSPNLSGPLELLWSVMEPGADSGAAYHHSGDEAGVLIRGELELWVGDQHYLLGEGDSFSFPSGTPHRYRNPGTTSAELVWVVTPPSY